MIRILIATHNKKKRTEIRSLLRGFKKIKVINFDDVDMIPPIIVEDGKTFRQNAVKKAVTTSRFFDGLVLADDSGLEVDALGGKPGVRSARFARVSATDAENNRKLLKLLDKIPKKKRKGQFVCYLALAKDGTLLDSFEGTAKGEVIAKPRGKNGFGYDPLFIPKGYKLTFAENSTLKHSLSHRTRAFQAFAKSLK